MKIKNKRISTVLLVILLALLIHALLFLFLFFLQTPEPEKLIPIQTYQEEPEPITQSQEQPEESKDEQTKEEAEEETQQQSINLPPMLAGSYNPISNVFYIDDEPDVPIEEESEPAKKDDEPENLDIPLVPIEQEEKEEVISQEKIEESIEEQQEEIIQEAEPEKEELKTQEEIKEPETIQEEKVSSEFETKQEALLEQKDEAPVSDKPIIEKKEPEKKPKPKKKKKRIIKRIKKIPAPTNRKKPTLTNFVESFSQFMNEEGNAPIRSTGTGVADAQSLREYGYIKKIVQLLGMPSIAPGIYAGLARTVKTPALVTLVISKNGELLQSKIVKTSGSNTFDDFILNWIKSTRNFSPIPDYLNRNTYEFTFYFDPFHAGGWTLG